MRERFNSAKTTTITVVTVEPDHVEVLNIGDAGPKTKQQNKAEAAKKRKEAAQAKKEAAKLRYAKFQDPGKFGESRIAAALAGHRYRELLEVYWSRASDSSSDNICPACEKSSNGKKTSKAHSCVSRKTLEIAFRFGLSEFYAAASVPLRPWDEVVCDVIDLNGLKTHATSKRVVPDSITSSLANLTNRFDYGLQKLTESEQAMLARDLADTLQADLHTVLTDPGLPGEYKKAFVGALCTAYRHLVLQIVKFQARRDTDRFLRLILQATAYAGGDNEPTTFNMNTHFNNLVGGWNTGFGLAMKWIDDNALNWGTQGDVEFGKQCVECENAQGDEDLSRRLIDHVIDERLVVNRPIRKDTSYGKLFFDLYPSPDQDRNTVWDLSNAVTCMAIEIFYKSAREAQVKAGPGARREFGEQLLGHLEALPHLFIAYMEILMLDFAHGEPFVKGDSSRRIVKVLAPPLLPLPTDPEGEAQRPSAVVSEEIRRPGTEAVITLMVEENVEGDKEEVFELTF